MEYESLEPYVDRQLADLPESIRQVMNPIRKMFWDGANLEGRIRLAKEHASQNDPALLNSRQILAQSAYDEVGLNGASIDWRYWAHQITTWSAAEAARLMSALDPDIFITFNERPGTDDPSLHCQKAGKIQRLAEREGIVNATPSEWLAWAVEKGIHVHAGLRIEVEHLPTERLHISETLTLTPAPESESTLLTQSHDALGGLPDADDVMTPTVEPLHDDPGWSLTKPERYQGYGKPMYDLLKAAHIAVQPRPKARDVLDAWKKNPPPDVTEVMADGIKYLDANGNTKTADLDAIRATINRMTSE